MTVVVTGAGHPPPMTSALDAAHEEIPHLVPARMLNELAYCPRLFYLEWVDKEFTDNYFTVHGRSVHRRSDSPSGSLPQVEEVADATARLRSVTLSSEREGLIAKIDVLELDNGAVEPVEVKRGRPAPVLERVWEPERVQVCAQVLLLRDHGYSCPRGWVYFTESRERVEVVIDANLIARTRELRASVRAIAQQPVPPAPLVGSPKCNGCSLVGICLPDEVNLLVREGEPARPRGMLVPREDALPLYVQGQGHRIGVKGLCLSVKDRTGAQVAEARLEHTSHVSVFGNVQVSTQALRELCAREIPVCYASYGGWLFGRLDGAGRKNVGVRIAQFEAARDPSVSLTIARGLVTGKIANSRTLLRRNGKAEDRVLRELKTLGHKAAAALSVAELLGIEGAAARVYFGAFNTMLKVPAPEEGWAFDLNGRNRRPPKDPVNALLSFAYSLLVKDCLLAAAASGFDPYLGFYHRPRYGRPALALDLMEEFRPLVADSTVVTVINTRVVDVDDFIRSGTGVALRDAARRRVIDAYERRLAEVIRHPVFGYRVSYRRVLAIQARLLGRYVQGEIDAPPTFKTR